jgi:polysaccharide biosynthesis transport protein
MDLAAALVELSHRSRLVIGVAVAAVVVAVAVTLLLPVRYEASATLAISPPKFDENTGPLLTTASFRPYLDSLSNAGLVVGELGLDKPPYSMNSAKFLSKAVSIEEIRNTNLLRVVVQLPQPELASRAASLLAARAIEAATRVNQDEAAQVRDVIKAQLDDARKRLDEAETRYTAFRKNTQIELLRKDVDAKLKQRGELLPLNVAIEGERAKLAAAESEKAARLPLTTLRRAIDSDVPLLESARAQGSGGKELLGLQVQDEQVNEVYVTVDEKVAETRSELASLEKQRSQLLDVAGIGKASLADLIRLYDSEATLTRMELEAELARKVYSDIATRFESTRLLVAGRSALLQVVDAPVPPDQAVSRHLARNALLALVVGLVLGTAAVLFRAVVKPGVAA